MNIRSKLFKVNSIDYLLKPIKKEDLSNSIEKYRSFQAVFGQNTEPKQDLNELIKHINLSERRYKNRFLVRSGDKLLSIQSEEISYFQLRQGVVHLQIKDGKGYLTDHTLDELTNNLDPEVFYRANRQFIISYDAISMVHKYHKGKLLVELKQKTIESIVVSMEKASSFKKWLG